MTDPTPPSFPEPPAPPPGGPSRSTPLGGSSPFGAPAPAPGAPPPGSPGSLHAPSGQSPPGQPSWGQPSWGQQVRPAGTNGMAIAAMVLGLLWLCGAGSVLGVVFGFVALAQIRRTNQSGRGFAIAGIVLGILGIVATIATVIVLVLVADDVVNPADEVDDVTVTTCAVGDDGEARATLLIANNSARTSDYDIVVTFRSGDERTSVDVGVEDVASITADAAAPVERTVTAGEPMPAADLQCQLTFVDRRASTGGSD